MSWWPKESSLCWRFDELHILDEVFDFVLDEAGAVSGYGC